RLASSAQPLLPAASAVRGGYGPAHGGALLRGRRKRADGNPGEGEAAQGNVPAALRSGSGDFSGGAGVSDERLPALGEQGGGSGTRPQRAESTREDPGLRERSGTD